MVIPGKLRKALALTTVGGTPDRRVGDWGKPSMVQAGRAPEEAEIHAAGCTHIESWLSPAIEAAV
jgi:hypothetical protein